MKSILSYEGLKLKYRMKYGIELVMDRIERILFKHFDFMLKNEEERKKILNEIRKEIKIELLGKNLSMALAKDVLSEEGINLNSHVFKFIKTRIYKGNTRKLLSDLQGLLKEDKSGKRNHK